MLPPPLSSLGPLNGVSPVLKGSSPYCSLFCPLGDLLSSFHLQKCPLVVVSLYHFGGSWLSLPLKVTLSAPCAPLPPECCREEYGGVIHQHHSYPLLLDH